MAGAYCKFCNQRCFVLRVLPADARLHAGESMHLATCAAGMELDREKTGYDHTTAINPLAPAEPKPEDEAEEEMTECP